MPLYETLADAYDWLVPDALLDPAGSASALAPALAEVPAGGRVLDCAAGTGQLAVGLALRGNACGFWFSRLLRSRHRQAISASWEWQDQCEAW